MSAYTLTTGSAAALRLIANMGGSETLLLIQPERDLRPEITIEPLGTLLGSPLEAVLYLGNQRHRMRLQRGDSANAQHLAEWVEAIANGTLDTAEAIPQRSAPAPLLPCRECEGSAIGYDYAGPGETFLHGVKCQFEGCQTLEGASTAAEAHDAWNTLQGEPGHTTPDGGPDMINHPPRYAGHPSGVECIEVAEHLPFCLGKAFEYLYLRDAKGNPLENIEMAIWYVNRHQETYPDKPAMPAEAREALGMIVVHEPYPFGSALLLIAGVPQCGGYDACLTMLTSEAERLRSGAEPLRAA